MMLTTNNNNNTMHSLSNNQRIIIHTDLDCFFVQCEQHRINNNSLYNIPIAIQQHDDIISLSYEARKLGILKHSKPNDIKQQYPQVKIIHVPYSYGWKVSYEYYRRISHNIFTNIKQYCNTLYKTYNVIIEKTSIDECYIDCTVLIQHIHSLIQQQQYKQPTYYYGCIYGLCKHKLPTTSICQIQCNYTELDYTTQLLCIASELCYNIRQYIYNKLQYTCSGGISINRLLSKQIGKYNKPNNQTILLQQYIQSLLYNMKITDIPRFFIRLGKNSNIQWNNWLKSMGYICNTDTQGNNDDDNDSNNETDVNDDTNNKQQNDIDKRPPIYYISDVQSYTLEQLQQYFGHKTAQTLYDLCRGIDNISVTSSTLPNKISVSMSLQPVTDIYRAKETIYWLCLEIVDRITEEIDINNRRAKNISFGYRLENMVQPVQITISFNRFAKLYNNKQYIECSDSILSWIISDILNTQIIHVNNWSLRWTALSLTNFESVAKNTLSDMFTNTTTATINNNNNINNQSKQINGNNNHNLPLIVIPAEHEKQFLHYVHQFNRDFYFKFKTLSNNKKHELYQQYCELNHIDYTMPSDISNNYNHKSHTDNHNNNCAASDNNTNNASNDNNVIINNNPTTDQIEEDLFFDVADNDDNTSQLLRTDSQHTTIMSKSTTTSPLKSTSALTDYNKSLSAEQKRKRDLLVPTSVRKKPHSGKRTLESYMFRQ